MISLEKPDVIAARKHMPEILALHAKISETLRTHEWHGTHYQIQQVIDLALRLHGTTPPPPVPRVCSPPPAENPTCGDV